MNPNSNHAMSEIYDIWILHRKEWFSLQRALCNGDLTFKEFQELATAVDKKWDIISQQVAKELILTSEFF